MAVDTLILGAITFDGFSPPERMMAGGKQTLVVHKLPGGSRVIDTLGPDEADITWSGFFFGNNAYANCLALDAMRAAGQVVSLTWGGSFRDVIVSEFIFHVRRSPVWCEYAITCAVVENPALGDLTSTTDSVDSSVSDDLSSAASPS
jgi:hypothetical protein